MHRLMRSISLALSRLSPRRPPPIPPKPQAYRTVWHPALPGESLECLPLDPPRPSLIRRLLARFRRKRSPPQPRQWSRTVSPSDLYSPAVWSMWMPAVLSPRLRRRPLPTPWAPLRSPRLSRPLRSLASHPQRRFRPRTSRRPHLMPWHRKRRALVQFRKRHRPTRKPVVQGLRLRA